MTSAQIHPRPFRVVHALAVVALVAAAEGAPATPAVAQEPVPSIEERTDGMER
ncbi:MAG: hypothetical protein GWO00_05540, partial [Gemmatimonadetes bacterium]|nr:hypothetical protein [Gemmatimonadota bacterium]NIP77990.1 hypothetical protein [Gemmatimonadota bacterium]NIR77855.1 hypothetical protein [Gemmatimonadota bacterium]NIV60626.1 hypothetical protein [Gemmatimonadota bacterium]NIW63303.1 hypothetical protein [Gemmatimonadota bacterium]